MVSFQRVYLFLKLNKLIRIYTHCKGEMLPDPIRLIPSADQQTLTLFLQDSYHCDWFTKPSDARYGFLAICDRYQKFGCDFYLASYYHFAYLLGKDYEVAVAILTQKLDRLA